MVQEDDGSAALENHGLVNDEIEVKQEPELILMDKDDEAEFERILQDDDDGNDLSNDLTNLSIEYEQSPSEPDGLNVSVEIEFEEVDSFPKPMVCTEMSFQNLKMIRFHTICLMLKRCVSIEIYSKVF